MGSLGLPAIAMAVRSAFALLCFALLCGLAASSAVQSKTETELKEGEAAGNQVLVEQALESRVVRGSNRRKKIRKACKGDINPKRCERQKTRGRNNRTRGKPKKGGNPCKKDKTSQECKKRKDRNKQKRGKKVQQRKKARRNNKKPKTKKDSKKDCRQKKKKKKKK